MIHTFGDSHCMAGWEDCSNVEHHHLGAILCHTFGTENLERCDISKYGIEDGDSVVFCFGEIDCRCHIKKHINRKNTYHNIIDCIVLNYVESIAININKCEANIKNICIYNIVPPVERHNTAENRRYPFVGTDEERKQYAIYFNECLKLKCDENKWLFVDVYNDYCDTNGFLNKQFSDDNVHIKNPVYLQQYILNYIN